MRLARQRGVALLVAIIMFAIATTVAAAITYNKAMSARRAAATFTLEQALQAGMAAEALASIALENDGSNNRTELHREWAQPLGPVEIEGTGIWIQAQLEDMTARFNLNSLVQWVAPPVAQFEVDLRQLEVFRNLLIKLNIDPRFADLWVDWLDSDINPQATGGGEDTLYLTQVPPYRPPNTFVTHTSELLALPGFGPENFKLIAPYVTALPNDVAMNNCTASGVLIDLNNNDPSATSQWENVPLDINRKKGCYPIKSDLQNGFGDPQRWTLAESRYNEKSSWFRLRSNIRIGTAEFVLYSVLFREPSNRVRVFQRSFGSE